MARRFLTVACLAAAALVSGGCGSQSVEVAKDDPNHEGAVLFVERCGACHAVRGSEAGGAAGPDLTHLMSRATLAAGTVPNTVSGLAGWIANPQALKPGARMPVTGLSGAELGEVTAYLETLR